MVNKPRIKGTLWETAVCQYLREHGFLATERRALAGNTDRGDIAGIQGVMVEAKNTTRLELGQFMAEVQAQTANANAWLGVAWIKRRGKTSPGSGYVVMTGEQFTQVLLALKQHGSVE